MLKSRGFWIGVLVSVACVAVFVLTSDVRHPAKLRDAFSGVNYWWLVASIPVYYAGLWVRTIRWRYLLRPVKRVTTLRLYPVVIIGLMANNLIPARAGELARAYVLGERENISKTTALGTIAVDRVFDGVTLVPMMLIVAAFAGSGTSFRIPLIHANLNFAELGIVMAVLFGVAIGVLFYLAFSTSGRDLLHKLIHRFAPASVKPKVEGLLESFFEGLRALRSPIDLGAAWAMSLISWTLEALMYYLVARGFGIHEGFHIFLLLTAAVNLAIVIIATQGGVGAFEFVTKQTIITFGASVKSADASAYAIGLHVLLLLPIVVIGLALMWSMNLTFGQMLKGERQMEAEVEAPGIEEEAAARTARPSNAAVEGSGPK